MNEFLQFIFFCIVAGLPSSVPLELPSVRITSVNSNLCSEHTPFSSIGNFSACFFAKVSSREGVIFALRDISKNDTFLISHVEDHLVVDINNQTTKMSRKIEISRWTQICVRVNNAKEVEIYINYIVEKWTFDVSSLSQISENLVTSNDTISQLNNDTASLQVCIGDPKYGESFIGEISGLFLQPVNETLIKRDFECIFYTNKTFEDFHKWQHFHAVKTTSKNSLDVCMDTFQFMIQESSESYIAHASTCKSLRGRLLLEEEITLLNNTIKEKSEISCKRKNKSSWIESETKTFETLDDLCSVFTNGEIRQQSCIIEANCNVCIFPYYLQIKLFGPLPKFDRKYDVHLSKKNVINHLTGSNFSEIVHTNWKKWILKSSLHEDKWEIADQLLPLGRKNWTNVRTQERVILTLTACSENDFTCNDGSCLPFSKRCDTEVDCSDASDELDCNHIQTKSGYDTKKIPYSLDGSPWTPIRFFARIYNIRDISPTDGKIIFNILLIFYWEDPRLIIWNPTNDKEVDCNDIWHPSVTMVSSQMIVEHNQYRASCKIRNYPRELAPPLTKSLMDPYMGSYSDGSNETLSYWYAGMATMFCKQDQRKYPFGRHTCALDVFSDHNSMYADDYKFVPSLHQEQYEDNEVLYTGERELGEYYLSNIHYELIRKDMKIKIIMELESLSGFHLLNSYTPSFLMCFISYGSFLFPLENFNERIMASLTVLLVLATLLNQASGSSVKTPYFKSLDIWFVVLIIYCFLIVIINIVIHLLLCYEKEKGTSTQEPEKNDLNEINSVKNKCLKWGIAKIINVLSMILFATFFIVFVFIYSLEAADII